MGRERSGRLIGGHTAGRSLGAAIALIAALSTPAAAAENVATGRYQLTIVNTNTGQNFSPPVIVLHTADYRMFEVGRPATEALWRLAEDGATDGFLALQDQDPAIEQVLLGPSVHRRNSPIVTLEFEASSEARLSLAAMLTLTNDGFVAVQQVNLPAIVGQEVRLDLLAYDAGSEANTESCAHVPCEVHGKRMTEGAEGMVRLHPGIRGDADIPPRRGWTKPPLGVLKLMRID